MRAIGTTGGLVELAFESVAAPGLPQSALERLANYTSSVNPRCDLTGELRLDAGRFRYVVEGREEVVLALAARILADPRHGSIHLAAFRTIERRRFDAWHVHGFGCDQPGPGEDASNLTILSAVASMETSQASTNVRRLGPVPTRGVRLVP